MTEPINRTLEIENKPFFFIVSRPRSGTTLIQTLFEAHPNVCIPPEAPVIAECYDRFGRVQRWTEQEVNLFIDFLYHISKFEFWNIDKEKLAHFIHSYTGDYSLEILIKLVYMDYKSVFEKKELLIFGDKNPRYSRYPNKILRIFPDARFIHLVRDYRDHILSMQRVKLLNSYLPLIAIRWRKSQKKMLKYIKKYPENFISIRYEDFVGDPTGYFEKICAFLNIEFSPDIFDYHKQEEKFKTENKYQSDEVFHGNIFKPITSDQVGKWQKNMDENSIREADFFVGKYAELSGYERVYKKFDLLTFFRTIPGYAYVYGHAIYIGLLNLIPIRLRKNLTHRFPSLRYAFFGKGKKIIE
ncbi:MAG: sulfotransferase [Bacteroidales bacterium]